MDQVNAISNYSWVLLIPVKHLFTLYNFLEFVTSLVGKLVVEIRVHDRAADSYECLEDPFYSIQIHICSF